MIVNLVYMIAAASISIANPRPAAAKTILTLNLRAQSEEAPGKWKEVDRKRRISSASTAIVICDMWDNHWCKSASARCGEIAKRMELVLQAARNRGVLIVHAPSECMDAYKDTAQRKVAIEARKVPLPAERNLSDPPLPIDDSDGGCDDEPQCKNYKAWTREHPALTIAADDVVSDNGAEIYNLLKARGINTVLIMGVHTNMCVLRRSFAIRQMTKWGVSCVLVRDLTDTMYNPRMKPNVPHAEGTALVVNHIEKYWCPSMLSKDLTKS
jgi:nicotinamidase-related amidase